MPNPRAHDPNDGLPHFFRHKAIQPSFLFYVTIYDEQLNKFLNGGGRTPLNTEEQIKSGAGGSTFGHDGIKEWMVASCELPFYDFNKEYSNYSKASGAINTFPQLNHDGFEFTIKFEEDNHGTIQSLIHHFSNRIIDSDGYYRPKKQRIIGDASNGGIFELRIERNERNRGAWAKTFTTVTFFEAYFLKSSTASFSYDATDKVTYDITFNCDYYRVDYGDDFQFSYDDRIKSLQELQAYRTTSVAKTISSSRNPNNGNVSARTNFTNSYNQRIRGRTRDTWEGRTRED